MIKITKQGYITELGKRVNNEDNCGYISGSAFVVCDGVGGAEKGEIASDITTRCFIESFQENPVADANDVLQIAEDKLSRYIEQNPDAMGMATTLTLSHIRENEIYVAWCGDSRVYQFRRGQIVFKTTDHSWVNEALKSGIITPEEAINHPKSNIITRAVQGTHKPTSADTVLLTDIQQGDIFMHCTDGVLESWTDDDLSALFASENEPEKILQVIKEECSKYSKDNFTAIVYLVDEAILSMINVKPAETDVVETLPVAENEIVLKRKTSKLMGVLKGKYFKKLFIPLLLIIIISRAYVIFTHEL